MKEQHNVRLISKEGGTYMSEKEKDTAKTLAEAFEALPDSKKEFLLGYAEGVAAMAEKKSKSPSGRS